MAFYSYTDNVLYEAPNFVSLPIGIDLTVDNKDEHTYPVEGWYWFDTEELAKEFFGIK
jgi:hypothetical protein